LIVRIADRVIATLSIDCTEDRISAVYAVVNPEKLPPA
jgi:hypothetical protein